MNNREAGTNNSEAVTNSSEVVLNGSEERANSPAVRASDAERDQVAAQLQHHYAVGRLTLPELEERVAGAHEARTREQLDALVSDLPGEPKAAASPTYEIDSRLLIILLCTSPPAALVYWLIYYIREKNL
ncbi:DUF1707 domain-containing protein [Kribbella sp. VKM Ac-2568]|uniref:DUF1707 SHOCT-like domain-containing protein n=1 Tax=Kribbella sp. VKM Ac-2568 TaxID=2512219 RepID=UPI00104C1446|nr:DUF1707 domain-containing protein [Kribbella sp. VKM Ac-2568]TCM42708.1 uncharacterized protein DUF1707 [Kribbella sp. VKM Ac-2568]